MKPIDHVHHYHGKHGAAKCGTCSNLISGWYNGKFYYKCTLYGCSHCAATDWRPSWDACRLHNADITGYRDVKEIVRANRRSEPDGVVEGQIELF